MRLVQAQDRQNAFGEDAQDQQLDGDDDRRLEDAPKGHAEILTEIGEIEDERLHTPPEGENDEQIEEPLSPYTSSGISLG